VPASNPGTAPAASGSSGGSTPIPTATIGRVLSASAAATTDANDCNRAALTCRLVPVADTVASSGTGVAGTALPHTGTDAGSMVGLGSSLVLLGASVSWGARRRRPVPRT
jgi:LPXTG-motif cell wall-anchored protein